MIIAEADRLNDLMSRLLSSHCMMRPAPLNIPDVLERVSRLILAEFFIQVNLMKRAEGELNRLLAIFPSNREARALLDSIRAKT